MELAGQCNTDFESLSGSCADPEAAMTLNSVPIFPRAVDGNGGHCLNRKQRALNSAVECHPHTVEVVGSNPTAPTIHPPGCDGSRHCVPELVGRTVLSAALDLHSS